MAVEAYGTVKVCRSIEVWESVEVRGEADPSLIPSVFPDVWAQSERDN